MIIRYLRRVLLVLVLSASAANAQWIALDPEVWGPLRAFGDPAASEEQRQRLRETLHKVPNWEERLAQHIAELAMEARLDETKPLSDAEVNEIIPPEKRWRLTGSTPEQAEQRWRREAHDILRNRAGIARDKLGTILMAVQDMRDKHAVRLIAPLLSERSKRYPHVPGEPPPSPPQDRAAGQLGAMVAQNVPLPGTPPPRGRAYDLDLWRDWWKENRQHYEPIPAALAALEASQGGTKSTPAPSTPAPAASTPTPTPKASPAPLASPSPVAQVPTPAKKPIGLILACIAGALVLIVLVARRSAHR